MPEMDTAEIYLMLGDHGARLRSIEATTAETGANVRSLMAQFHTVEGAHKAHGPYVAWIGRATSTLAAGLAGAWAGLHFGFHK